MSADKPLRVGGLYDVNTAAEGHIGSLLVDTITPNGTVRGALTLDGPERSRAESALRLLAEAADELAFAVMAREEEALRDMTFGVADHATGLRLMLGVDFEAIYVNPEITRLSFRLRSPS